MHTTSLSQIHTNPNPTNIGYFPTSQTPLFSVISFLTHHPFLLPTKLTTLHVHVYMYNKDFNIINATITTHVITTIMKSISSTCQRRNSWIHTYIEGIFQKISSLRFSLNSTQFSWIFGCLKSYQCRQEDWVA